MASVRAVPVETRRLVIVGPHQFNTPVDELALAEAIVWVRPPPATEAAALAAWKRAARAAGAVRVQDLPPEATAAELPAGDAERVADEVDPSAALDVRGVVTELLARASARSEAAVDWAEVARLVEDALARAGL